MKNNNINLFKKIVKILDKNDYQKIQYFPSNFSFLAVGKEFENILNIFLKKKHLLFYYSLFPKIYLIFLNNKTQLLRKIFYLNESFSKQEIEFFFKKKEIRSLIKSGIILQKKEILRLNFSFVPYKKFIFVRDQSSVYKGWFNPKKLLNKVWMGSDTIIFLRFLEKYLKRKNFKKALEIGSGTGTVILSLSQNFEINEAVDINSKAVKITFLNAKINNVENFKIYKSNLYQKIKGKYDLIISNPWFVDLRKGGLEVLPKIIDKLDKYLEDNGTCLLLMNSFFKNKKDTLEEYFLNILKKKKYDVNLFSNGVFYEFERNKDYKKNAVEYAISYNVEIKKRGSGILTKYHPNLIRRFRDKIFLKFLSFKKN